MPRRAALGLLLAATLVGCATSNTNPYPYFERLEVVALAPASAEEIDAMPSAGESAAAGAVGGAMGGFISGLFMSLACGPYFAVCFAGTGAAALGGATAGAVIAGSIALAPEEAERVGRYLENMQQTRNLSEELATAVAEQLPADRLAAPGAADARLGLEAQGLGAAPGFADTLTLTVGAKASLNWGLDRDSPLRASRSFTCTTEPLPLEDWLSGNDASAERELNRCIEDLAAQVGTALQEPTSDPAAGPASAAGFGEASW